MCYGYDGVRGKDTCTMVTEVRSLSRALFRLCADVDTTVSENRDVFYFLLARFCLREICDGGQTVRSIAVFSTAANFQGANSTVKLSSH